MIDTSLPVVLLDLDNTILDFDMAERTAVSKTFVHYGVEPTASTLRRYNEINTQQWELLEQGKITRVQVLSGRFKLLFDELGVERDCEAVQEMYEELLCFGHWFMPGAEELFEKLEGKYRLFLCSNGTARVQAGRLASAGIEHFFEKIFVSEIMGANKPSPEYFRACFNEIPGIDLSRTIMIGDSMSSDILGGINAGIRTCWYNPKDKTPKCTYRANHEVCELSEIPELLKKIFP